MRMTNEKIIREMLPRLHEKVRRFEAGENWQAHNGCGKLFVSEVMYLYAGKYDKACLEWPVGKSKEEGLFYSKEYVGCGNGYYALIDYHTGQVIKGEWD